MNILYIKYNAFVLDNIILKFQFIYQEFKKMLLLFFIKFFIIIHNKKFFYKSKVFGF